MRTFLGCLLVVAIGAAAACGGTSSPLLDANDGGSQGDGGKKDGSTHDGGCVNPVFGESCVAGEAVCGQVGDGNPCCDQAWRCVSGKWQSFAAECACQEQSETCGDLTCTAGQYCLVQPPGIALEDGGIPPTSYACMDPPAACGATATCSCLEENPPCSIASCTDSSGEVKTAPILNCIGE
ncbi:MAG: hypothetical protein ACRELY_27810 [Polyangiaceae bacterium]